MENSSTQIRHVDSKRGLAVCPCRDKSRTDSLTNSGEELSSTVPFAPLKRNRWHDEPDTVREQCNYAIYVACFKSGGKARHELVFKYRPWRRRWFLPTPLMESALQGGSSALERADHTFLGRIKNLRDILGCEPQHVAQDKSPALTRRKQLQSCYECERNGFPSVVPRLRTGCPVGDSLQENVRVRLKPKHLVQVVHAMGTWCKKRCSPRRHAPSALAVGKTGRREWPPLPLPRCGFPVLFAVRI